MNDNLKETAMLDFSSANVKSLVKQRGWNRLDEKGKSRRDIQLRQRRNPFRLQRERQYPSLEGARRRLRTVQHQGYVVYGAFARLQRRVSHTLLLHR